MRLINADEVKNYILTEGFYCDTRADREDTAEEIDLLFPTVKAIPIEWIKGYITPFQAHHDSLSEELKENDGAGWVVDVLETMLREWEQENENNSKH